MRVSILDTDLTHWEELMNISVISVNACALIPFTLYVAHKNGGWGPENKGEYQQNKMTNAGGSYVLDGSFLKPNEEFKIIIPNMPLEIAYRVYAERQTKGAHVNNRMDYDQRVHCFWLLANSHPVARPEKWNQTNVYSA